MQNIDVGIIHVANAKRVDKLKMVHEWGLELRWEMKSAPVALSC